MKCTNCGKIGSETLCAECDTKKETAVCSEDNGKDNLRDLEEGRCPTCHLLITDQKCTCFAPKLNIHDSSQVYVNIGKRMLTKESFSDNNLNQERPTTAVQNSRQQDGIAPELDVSCPKTYHGDQDHSQSDDSDEYKSCESADVTCDSADDSEMPFYDADEDTIKYLKSNIISDRETFKDKQNSDTSQLQHKGATNSHVGLKNDKNVPHRHERVIQNENASLRNTVVRQTNVDTFETELIKPGTGFNRRYSVTNNIAKNSEVLAVRFHVYVSIEMMSQLQDRLYIRFDNVPLDGWQSLKHEMKKVSFTKKYEGKFFEYEYSIAIQRGLLEKGIVYKYVVVNKDSNEENWEYYKSDTYHGDRTLKPNGDFEKSIDVWHQYDGIVLPERGLLKKAFSYLFSDTKRLAIGYVNDLIPQLFTRPMSQTDRPSIKIDIEHCIMLFDGAIRVYVTDLKCWSSKYDLNVEVTGSILTKIIHAISKQQTHQSSTDRVLQTLCVAVVCQRLGLLLKSHTWAYLCESLLLSVDADNKNVVEIESIRAHFGEETIQTSILYIVNCYLRYNNRDKPSWLFCLPLLHITSGICKPFQEPDRNFDISSEQWWGTDHVLDVALDTRKRNCNYHVDIIEKLKPLYKMDCYLSRSITRTINTDECHLLTSDLLSLESACAFLLRRTRTRNQPMEEAYQNVIIRLQSNFENQESSEGRCWVAYKLMSELIMKLSGKLSMNAMLNCLHVFLHCLSRYDNVLKERQSRAYVNYGQVEEHLVHLNSIATRCFDELSKIKHIPLLEYLKTWNLAFPEMLPSETVLNIWIGKASNRFKTTCFDRVQHSETDTFLEHYCSGEGHYSQPMYTCLSEVAFKIIESGKLNINASRMTQSGIPKYAGLLSKLFLEQWGSFTSTTDVATVLEQALTWVPMKQFIEHHKLKDDPGKSCLLTKETLSKLSEICTVLHDFGESISHGTVTVRLLELVCNHANQFCNIYECFNVDMTLPIECRKKELHAFKHQAGLMKEFVNTCRDDQVEEINEILNRELMNQQLLELCDTNKCRNTPNSGDYVPQVLAFVAFPRVVDILDQFLECQKSYLFKAFWNERRIYLNTSGLSIDEIIEQVWIPVFERWLSFGREMESGKMLFKTFQKELGNVFQNADERLKEEIMTFRIQQKGASDFVNYYNDVKKIESSIASASLFLEMRQHFNLLGDFSTIEEIYNYSEREFTLDKVDEYVMQSCGELMLITFEERDCLKALMKCKPLITWLQESMAGEELKVFIDLAMMSAGDEPINIEKVQCLHSAVTGYSPLIFELEARTCYTQLLDKCNSVWKELKTNPGLPNQIIDTNSQLAWLEEIKKAHGSVEVTSLKQAEAINNDGLYIVGIDAEGDFQGKTMVEHDILKLVVPEKDGERLICRTYSLPDVQDLHSRLMLVSGKSSQDTNEKEVDVDMFTLIFDSVTRVGLVYRQLCESGCVLFNNFKAEFMCNTTSTDRPVCVTLEFNDAKDSLILRGRKSENESLKEMIPEIAKCMETCLQEWLHYIKTKREEYIHLNYFTIGQLIILQRELVKAEGLISNDVYPLLSAVKCNCVPDDFKSAMTKARTDVAEKSKISTREPNLTHVLNQEDVGDGETDFVRKLVSSGITEEWARRSLQHVDKISIQSLNIKTAKKWVMLERAKERSGPVKEETAREKPKTWGALSNYQTVSSTPGNSQTNVGSAPLIRDLQQCWQSFLGSVSAPNSDYLSLEHLGIILKHLADEDSYSRILPENLTEGEPNLIMCKKEEFLLMTLSIYMLDDSQPLPRSDEVLLCTDQTSYDEVDIFLRRAMFANGKKIHCLVNADVLGYETSALAIQLIKENIKMYTTKGQYRLCVICEASNENRSQFGIALHKYLHRMQPSDIEKLKSYVVKHLTIPSERMHSAAGVDFNRSSARLIKSSRAGLGKSLYVKRVGELLVSEAAKLNLGTKCVSIPLQEKRINIDEVIRILLEHTPVPGVKRPRLFHIDISTEVEDGIDFFLFNLLILDCVVDKHGYVWRRDDDDLYLIEAMPMMKKSNGDSQLEYKQPVYSILPDMTCKSPQECLKEYECRRNSENKEGITDQLCDETNFKSEEFQRAFQYLRTLDQTQQAANRTEVVDTLTSCLKVLMGRCGIVNPSWSDIHYFVLFLNTQLVDYEHNQFVSCAAEEDLPGFSIFVLRFLIQMSKDFATRSLNISEDTSDNTKALSSIGESSNGDNISNKKFKTSTAYRRVVKSVRPVREDDTMLSRFELRRTWETSPHPYILFNFDRGSFTFLGFNIDTSSGDLIDVQTRKVLEKKIMGVRLIAGLNSNGVSLRENADILHRQEKIKKLCSVMGVDNIHDPDPTYELTMDNMKKILAIYMRFRCGIPVIVMGETGCGKTRLVKFMCALQCPPDSKTKNIILVKVHGGTTKHHIKKAVHQAEEIAKQNVNEHGQQMYTVLFFDEANTTEANGIFKEIMCDKSICGKRIEMFTNLKIIAACNPYRKHPDHFVKQLEQAGLGYHVDASETTDTLGKIPMRRLVYRVQPLPQSLLPLVWDFGQLNTEVEKLYIIQIVKQCQMVIENDRQYRGGLTESLSDILAAAQQFMRNRENECSFVSLRDIERFLLVMTWFYNMNKHLFPLIDYKLAQKENSAPKTPLHVKKIDNVTRSLILALGVCYHACLKERNAFRRTIAATFKRPFELPGGEKRILQEIESCQDVFLDNVLLNKNIARNTALRENVFMMVVCIELRIPLFLVGKPGSSKSLAKTIVADAMQGKNSRGGPLFKQLKQVQMISFQCSPLATSEGIISTFKQCAQFQKDKDLDKFVSVVVLDEIGLAEDSPRMPLKTLHPLLEDGCVGDETPEKYKKVAFIGISNWALDPAKMNRGILVQREVPDLAELENSARGICYSTETDALYGIFIKQWIEPLARGYTDVFNLVSKEREFFGLRDFYSLVKMVYRFVTEHKAKPSRYQIVHAIKRNFGGLDYLEPDRIFMKYLGKDFGQPTNKEPDCTARGLIEASLSGCGTTETESRYLLLLTEKYGALSMIRQKFFKNQSKRPIIIFGSHFRSDREYTQVCRNINKIKVCMGTGKTVILLNLENLYESLYDALNQYYVTFGNKRYVDLGLGTHRVKCHVHKNFRLIVVAEKQTVYKRFPIPLINRLEKHIITGNTMLDKDHLVLAQMLQSWVTQLSQMKEADVIIGFHDDACSASVMHVTDRLNHQASPANAITECEKKEIFEKGKQLLLWCVTPDSLWRDNGLSQEEMTDLREVYFHQQAHENLIAYLRNMIVTSAMPQLFAQITCHSKVLPDNYGSKIIHKISSIQHVEIVALCAFDTEQQFCTRIRHFLDSDAVPRLLIIQCDSGDRNANLVACAENCVLDEFEKKMERLQKAPAHVAFVIQLPRKIGGCFTGFQCGIWNCVHIDDLYEEEPGFPNLTDLFGKTIGDLLLNLTPEVSSWDAHNDARNILSVERPAIRVDGLIVKAVPSALSLIQDRHMEEQRKTQRLVVVHKCLQNSATNEDSFTQGILKIVGEIIKAKEERIEGYLAKTWLSSVAASNENIYQNGTFRQACYQTMISKIAPVLAYTIAFLDTNSNLDLALSHKPWKRDFWLRCITDMKIVNLKHDGLWSPQDNKQLREVAVPTVGYEGHAFKLLFPFSWLITQMTEELFRNSAYDVPNHGINVNAKLLMDGKFGGVLSSLGKEENQPDIINDYIHDFVHMVYNPKCGEKEQNLVSNIIRSEAERLYEQNKTTNDIPGLIRQIVCVRFAFEAESYRLTWFRSINDVWPECSIEISKTLIHSPEFLSSDHKLLGIIGLLTAHLEPQFLRNQDETRSKWLGRVYRSRYIVEHVFSLVQDDPDLQIDTLAQARSGWSRILTMKLFIENLFPDDKEDILTNEECTDLWNNFDADVNMKDVNSFESLEEYLKICNEIAVSKTIGIGAICSRCEVEMTAPPTVLPCAEKHAICKTCYMEIKTDLKKCPRCKEPFQDHMEPLESNKQEISRLELFQKQCNTFFLEVVTQLCFSEDQPPSEEVLSKLFDHVICKTKSGTTFTKNLSLFDTGLDPNPVFRSFLLQLIFKFSDIESVTKYIMQFLDNTKSSNRDNNSIGIYMLILQCYEDFRRSNLGTDEEFDYNVACEWITRAQEHFKKTETLLEIEEITKLLFCIGDVRVCFGIAGKDMANVVLKGADFRLGQSSRIIQKAQELCKSVRTDWPRVFLAKQLCRRFGLEVYRGVCNSSNGMLNWLAYNSEGDLMADTDRYIVCDTPYTNVRQAISKSLQQSAEIKHLKILLENLSTKDSHYEIYVQLAIHRLVSCADVWNATPDSENADALCQFLNDTSLIKDKAVICGLFSNYLQPDCLKIVSRTNIVYYGLQCLLTHFKLVLLACKQYRSLMTPFVALLNGEESIEKMFLPAMPDRNSDEILDAVGFSEMVYECQNGHKYLIGDCGRPDYVGKCHECGEEIGGTRHVTSPANKLDISALGHTLGRATEVGKTLDTRNLNSTYCTVARLLVHMAMYLGPVEKVQRIIRYELDTSQVTAFISAHITNNIEGLEQLLGRRADDIFLLMHHLLHQIMLKKGILSQAAIVETKQYRSLWESEFSGHVLHDVLSKSTTILTKLNQRLATDNRPGDPLMNRIFEAEGSEVMKPDNLLEDSRMWMYRTPTTIEHMLQKLESVCSNVKRYPVLQLFMKKDKILQALRYVPSILNLIRALLNRYLKKIDKVEALKLTIRTIKQDINVPEIHNWVNHFEKAWEITRPSLSKHVCHTENGVAQFPKEFKELCSQSITDNTTLALLLPSTDGPGLCSYAMLDFLFREQNSFLDDYIRMAGIKDIKHPYVTPMAVTSTHLISYDHDHDIMPLVLANCRYSFEVGAQTNIEYDFDGMERQLMDRLLNSKSKIEIHKYLQMDLIVYRTEMSNSSVFKRLNEIIKQEHLSFTVRTQIIEEFTTVADVCKSICNLDITISFLQTTGGDPNMFITTFMENTIMMKDPIHGQKIQQFCQLKHAKALWLLLSFQRSKLIFDFFGDIKDAFNTLRPPHFEEIPAESQVAYTEYLNSLNCDRLFNVIEVLHEFLLLKVAIPENTEDVDFVPTENMGLFVGLMAYNEVIETTDLDSFWLKPAPANILYKHSAEAWKMIYNTFKKKKGEIRH